MTEVKLRNALGAGCRLHWYEIEKVLGQGGFGITYLAHDANLEQHVAIKEYLPRELAVREGDYSVYPASPTQAERYRWGLDRFLVEAKTLARFKHTAIVRVLSVFEANNTAYMVMEYQHGLSLNEILERRRTLPEDELASMLEPLLDGLEAIHAQGFIHRDIKPANVFVRNDGQPVLLDFGSARQALGEQTQTLTSVVSPGYAPFEQYYSKGDRQGPWTDIYGLGATLYRCLSGVQPMAAIDRSEAILKAERDVFVSARELGAGCYSERFLYAVDSALEFDEAKRPQTIPAWRAQFGFAVSDEAPTALRVDPPPLTDARFSALADKAFELTPGAVLNPDVRNRDCTTGPTEDYTPRIASERRVSTRRATRGPPPESPRVGPAGRLVLGLFIGILVVAGTLLYQGRPSFPERLAGDATTVRGSITDAPVADPQARIDDSDAKGARLAAATDATATARVADPDRDTAPAEAHDNAEAVARAAEITALLQAAQADAAAGRWSAPAGGNALERYRRVLALDPANAEAAAGIRAVQNSERAAATAQAQAQAERAFAIARQQEGQGSQQAAGAPGAIPIDTAADAKPALAANPGLPRVVLDFYGFTPAQAAYLTPDGIARHVVPLIEQGGYHVVTRTDVQNAGGGWTNLKLIVYELTVDENAAAGSYAYAGSVNVYRHTALGVTLDTALATSPLWTREHAGVGPPADLGGMVESYMRMTEAFVDGLPDGRP